MEHIDATKLADFQKCPKLFEYKHVHGYRDKGDKIDLVFGSLLGEAFEVFEKELFAGTPHDEAHKKALSVIIEGARNPDGSNKFGKFLGSWRCKGEKPFKNEKGNPAKCPYSHKGKYFLLPAPDICSCGSATELHELWMPVKAGKDLDRLIELLVGYTDGALTRQLIPAQLDGKPLIEHYWETEFDHPMLIRPVLLCGNWDAVKSFGPEDLVVDYKSTLKPLNDTYWKQFTPNVQIDIYNMAARKILPNMNIKGVAIEAFSTAGDNGFKIFRATDEQKAEMFADTAFWIGLMQQCGETGIWPRNRANCFQCPFQPVCSRPPEIRQDILNAEYVRARWNPTTRQQEPINDQGQTKGLDTSGRNSEGHLGEASAGHSSSTGPSPADHGQQKPHDRVVLGNDAGREEEAKPRFSEGRPGGLLG